MNDQHITDRELELLNAIAIYQKAKNRRGLTENQWLAEYLHVTESAISKLKRILKDKGFLDARIKKAVFSPQAEQVLSDMLVVNPIEVALLGEVKAGRTKQDDLWVDMRDLSELGSIDVDTVSIPRVEDTLNVFALRVKGNSMEHENIFNEDYVLVQRFIDAEKPGQGELIIAKYLPIKEEKHVDIEQISSGISSPDDEFLEGPTVKYYYEIDDHIRLSVRKGFRESPFTIISRFVKPIGRVVGVYTEM